jgi:hypothetical protein
MDDSALTVEQLDALSRAVPEEQELKDLALYLEVGRAAPGTCSNSCTGFISSTLRAEAAACCCGKHISEVPAMPVAWISLAGVLHHV